MTLQAHKDSGEGNGMTVGPAQKSVAQPARGTRPPNRRQLIIDAATDLFSRKGYANVAMGDVAEAVAIGPSALYRHFSGKQDLLATVVGAALDTLANAVTAVEDARGADLSEELATAVLKHRGVGVLWHRESRQLAPADRRVFRAAIDQIAARFAVLIRKRRPALDAAEAELLAWSGLAVATSVSLHSLVLPEAQFITLLSGLISTVVQSPLPPRKSSPTRTTSGLKRTQTRREMILTEATKLFAANGFAGVSTEDIGATIGISGPSVYNHFPTKSDILLAAMLRGDEWLRLDMNRAFAQASDPQDGVNRLLDSYCAFVFDNPHLLQVLVSESNHLPEPERHRIRTAQHAYIDDWVNLLRQVHPSWDVIDARIRVQAVQTMINDIPAVPGLREQPGVESALVTLGAELLGISGRTGSA